MSAIVEAVKRLAIARGWLHSRTRPLARDNRPPWLVHFPSHPLAHVTIGSVPDWTARARGDGGWCVDPLTALLWSLLVGLDVEPVDVGTCPTCGGEGTTKVELPQGLEGFVSLFLGGTLERRPCRDCADGKQAPSGTGRDLRHPARLLLDAAPQPYTDDERMMFFGTDPRPVAPLGGCGDPVSTTHSPGDAETRAHLAVLADMWDSGRAMYTVTVAIPAEWAPHDLGPSLVAVRNDGRVGSIRQTPHGAPVTTTASGPCEILVTEATTRTETRPLRSQARWLVSWLMGWPGDSSEVCGAEMIEAATKIWKQLTVPCRLCPGFSVRFSSQGPVRDRPNTCHHCNGHGRVPVREDHGHRDRWPTGDLSEQQTTVADLRTRAASTGDGGPRR